MINLILRNPIHIIMLVVCIIISALLLSTSIFIVSEREDVIVTRFGKPMEVITTPGFYFKRPGFFETINRIETRIHVFTTQSIQLLLGDKNPIVVSCYVCWQVHKPLLFFQSLVNADIVVQKLGDMINSHLGSVLGDYTLDNIINTDKQIIRCQEIEERICQQTNADATAKYGVKVMQLGLRKIGYPDIVTQAVYNRMKSEREKEAVKYRAEGKEAAARIRAKTDREASDIMARSYKNAEILKGQGDRKALEIYTAAYGHDQEFFEFTKSMEVYQQILGEKATVMLSTDSKLFKYLNNPEGPN